MAIGTLRVILLWHMHQPFYKDLVTGVYRLPWVRMHALKDYYGMVKLLDEFPQVHQNFNLVPSLVEQITDYVAGTARDPFLDLVSRPASELTDRERRLALKYLFHAHSTQMIGRYPRYRELWERFRGAGEDPARADHYFSTRDIADLQVLSQLAWFDEFFIEQKDVQKLIGKGKDFGREEQLLMLSKQQEIMAAVLPAYRSAAERGSIEISATPYYHPILPLLCDTSQGAVSSPGLALPEMRFQHPEDAREQIRRALDEHDTVFGHKPAGMWPSEGSVSEEVLAIAAKEGVNWMATDEGVLARSLAFHVHRDTNSIPDAQTADCLYNIYRYEKGETQMHMVFRDHRISDLIGFVYAGMPAKDAASHLLETIKQSAAPVLRTGRDAVVSIILDGENAWETYERSGREFLRRFYDSLQREPGLEAVTISEAIARHNSSDFGALKSLVPGSWINANFNIWIGAQEDNKAWDYLSDARDYYRDHASKASSEQRALAYDELLIAEGSDWNWWYGPEHHSANDPDFDELYRKHLTNVYQALGGVPPEYLARPIAAGVAKPTYVPQSAYIRPRIDGRNMTYFDWIGAAMYSADRHTSSMHGKQFVIDAVRAGVDESNVYGRIDFDGGVPGYDFEALVHCDISRPNEESRILRFTLTVTGGSIDAWALRENGEVKPLAASTGSAMGVKVAFTNVLEFAVPLSVLGAIAGDALHLRFSIWRDRLPVDALPLEGSIELGLVDEGVMLENVYGAT